MMTKPKKNTQLKRKGYFKLVCLIRWGILKETFYTFLHASGGKQISNKFCDYKPFSSQKETNMLFSVASGLSDNIRQLPGEILGPPLS